jgi:hypothetical protein
MLASDSDGRGEKSFAHGFPGITIPRSGKRYARLSNVGIPMKYCSYHKPVRLPRLYSLRFLPTKLDIAKYTLN